MEKIKKIRTNKEIIRNLTEGELPKVQGGGMCSTGAFTGTCPTQSQTCTSA